MLYLLEYILYRGRIISYNDFEEYKRQGEPTQKEKAGNWAISIALQKVDDLTSSKYLIETVIENIEGKIDNYHSGKRIKCHSK